MSSMICSARASCANVTVLPALSILLPVLWFCWVAVPSCVPADAPPAAWSVPPQAARDTVIPAASINAHNFLFHLLIIFSYSSDPLFSNRNHLKSKLQPVGRQMSPSVLPLLSVSGIASHDIPRYTGRVVPASPHY